MAKASLNAGKPKRKPGGRPFKKGNPGGPGNPLAFQVNNLRAALVNAVTRADIEAIAEKLVERAKAGDVQAAREVLDRCIGKSMQPVEHTGAAGQPIEIVTYAGVSGGPA